MRILSKPALVCVLLLAVLAPAARAQEETKAQTDRWLQDALALNNSGDPKGALETLDRVLAIYRRLGDREGQGNALYCIGKIHSEQGEHREALQSFEQALAVVRERGNREDEAILLHEAALAHLELRQYPEAAKAFEGELAIQTGRGDHEGAGAAHQSLAFLEFSQGRSQQALEHLTQALALRREVGDRAGEVRALDNMAVIHERLGQPAKALELYQQALVIQREIGDVVGADKSQGRIAALRSHSTPAAPPSRRAQKQEEEALELNGEAIGFLQRGDPVQAQAGFERAIELHRKAGSRGWEGRTRASLGFALFAQGQYAEAQEQARQALALARETGDREGEGNPLNLLGIIHLAEESYPQALAFFQRALAVFRENDDLESETRVLQNVALIHLNLGDLAKAQEGLEQMRRLPYSAYADEAQTLLNLAAVQARRKQFPQALESLQKALTIQRRTRDPLIRTTLLGLGSVHGEVGEHAEALEFYQEALALDRAAGDRVSEIGTLSAIAGLHEVRGEHARALELYQQALAMNREPGLRTIESRIFAGLGRTHEAQGRLPEALDFFLRSIAIEEEIREAGQTEEINSLLGERSAGLYGRTVLLLLRLGRPAEAFDLAERARARAFLDQVGNLRPAPRKAGDRPAAEAEQEKKVRLAVAGLDHLLRQERARPRAEQDAQRLRSLSDQLGAKRKEYADLLARLKLANPEYASLVSVAPLKLADIQRGLEPDITLLSYFVTPEKTVAFVVTRDAFRAVELAVSEKDLAAAIADLRGFAGLGGPPSPRLAQLHAWLVAPVLAHLGTPLVGIVPHGVLHLLPFAALGDGQSPLGDRYTLFHLPSASTLPWFLARRKPARTWSLLALGQGQAAGLSPLRGAEQEARNVATLYGTQALVGREATETAFRVRAGGAGVLHLAAHGQLNPTAPVFSRIVLAPEGGPDTANDGALEVHEIYDLDLAQAGLVVLSACQTQLGAQSQGDDLVGLNRAFLHAGAPAVVASLWSVDDKATASLMTAFHRHLRQGLGKAAALREAQAEVRAKHSDPYYWAAFILTGDPK